MNDNFQQITVQEISQKRYLLEPVIALPRTDIITLYSSPAEVPSTLIRQLSTSTTVALDFETRGNDFSHPDFTAVGVGLSTDSLSIYVDLSSSDWDTIRTFLLQLGHLPLVGHNVMFDGGVFYRHTGWHANWKFCTYGLFKQLSSESNELRWGLKDAQKELLGWKETNEVELDQWLVENGYCKQNKAPIKGEMWRAPSSILGRYCALDAQSTWQLFTRVLQPALRPHPILEKYHQQDFLTEVEFLIEQQIHGITVDKERLIRHEELLRKQIEATRSAFYSHSSVSAAILAYNDNHLQDLLKCEPDRFRKVPILGDEPAPLTKGGKPSVNWDKWNTKKEKILNWEKDPENENKNWQKWKAQYEEALVTQHFNINSGAQLRWLFYDFLKYPVRVTTDSGLPSVDEDAFRSMGEAGQLIIDYMATSKEHGYVTTCLEHLRQRQDGLWRIHPQFRIPGTLTGRLAGSGGLNLQQLPKSSGYLACWRPMKEGHTWVDFDIVGAEAVVATELSRCPAMLQIYGPGVPKNDVYLYFGSQIRGLGEEILAAGYNPQTGEGLSEAKKKCKNLRNICKTVVLAKQYGAGAGKIHQTLTLQGVDIGFDEVKAISDGYDETFRVLKNFGRELEREWRERGGWVLNGVGRPMTVSDKYLKDLTNRVVQSTGHDIHMKCVRIFRDIMQRHRIPFHWVCVDFHDQGIIECRTEDAPRIKELISTEVVDKLNEELGGLIPIKYDPQIVRCLAEAKVEGYSDTEKDEDKDKEETRSSVT